MTRETEFLERWHKERDAYCAWGQLLSEEMQNRLVPHIKPLSPSYFLRTAVVPRAKDDQKLIEKAFYRRKPYTDPYNDITDKIGTRFVVLLGSDIRTVEKALISNEDWLSSKDRDFEEEQKTNPLKFDYAAVHFVVRPKKNTIYQGIEIPAQTPCEVQIKTLLQHAYSELTHDTIYKPQIQATYEMQRNAAKAMALLEATNDYFEKVFGEVQSAISSVRQITTELAAVYREFVGIEPKPTTLEGLILQSYEHVAKEDYIEHIRDFLAEKSFLRERIREQLTSNNPIFSQPSVLLVYFSIKESLNSSRSAWPLTGREMEPLLNDLGESWN